MDFSILQQAGPALVQLLTGPHLEYLLIGVALGMVVGILPGIGGLAGMAMCLDGGAGQAEQQLFHVLSPCAVRIHLSSSREISMRCTSEVPSPMG